MCDGLLFDIIRLTKEKILLRREANDARLRDDGVDA